MKRMLGFGVLVVLATGCVPTDVVSFSSRSALPDRVVEVDAYWVEAPAGTLKIALSHVTREMGLTLSYNAEREWDYQGGALKGSPEAIVKAMTQGLPVTSERDGKTIVVSQKWSIQPGMSLKGQLQSWASQSNWTVVWDSEDDLTPQVSAQFIGKFDMAAEQLFLSLRAAGSDLEPQFYSNRTVVVR
ncbi:toxin co-regulated pilus biosynthesis Q family protein [Marinobacterium stanieri]|uniref:Toxin co-regulated pilus biosynthesis protein Q n=1 Tax=Marinobacterium stanieri TaxID=49186 RepID=A0A1N6XHQ2_9GAMM|nr:toxin co-regulated pilus biosynthesis Q family protein [Marinobacterium stanieri]SIR01807.1 Toxin co-regulated pilus biosynthesis protein Q [Marinobacterium stanieri]